MNRLFVTISLVLVCFFLPLSCKKNAAVQCQSVSECNSGQACLEGTCQDVECSSSTDCAIHQFCGPKYSCEDGCETNDDCQAGETCADNSCTAYDCRDTSLDCEIGEYCDTTTGQCYKDDAGHCEECNWIESDTCADGNPCVIWDYDKGSSCTTDADCDDGMVCDDFSLYGLGRMCHADYCLVSCNAQDDDPCPAGFSCGQAFKNDVSTYCVADCTWLYQNGHL